MTQSLQHDYISDLLIWITDASTWEIAIYLSEPISSDKWFIIIDRWINLQEERLFFHRADNSVSNIVYVYWINRTVPTAHTSGSKVILDTISSINYTLDNIHHQFYIYKKSTSEVIITWGKWFRKWVSFTVADIDTSLWLVNQVLILNSINYVYVLEWVLYISDTDDGTKYIVWEIDVSITGNVNDIRKIKTYTFEGIQWEAATLDIGTVTTWLVWTSAIVTNSWTINDAIFDITIPQWYPPLTLEQWIWLLSSTYLYVIYWIDGDWTVIRETLDLITTTSTWRQTWIKPLNLIKVEALIYN